MNRILFFILYFLPVTCLSAQQQKQQQAEGIDCQVRQYLDASREFTSIYTGMREPHYRFRTQNHPYLDTDTFRKGDLYFNDCLYPDVLLRLNQDIEELSIMSADRNFSVLVPKESFSYATIDSLLIVRHKPVSADGVELQEGFYVRIYEGDCSVWKRCKVVLETKIEQTQLTYLFQDATRVYIVKDGIYHSVKSKKSVLKVFASKKKELKKWMRQTQLNYKANPEKAIVLITSYFDKMIVR